jgi:hypothetical protein
MRWLGFAKLFGWRLGSTLSLDDISINITLLKDATFDRS